MQAARLLALALIASPLGACSYFSNTEQDENFIRLSMGATRQTTQRALELLRTEKGYQTVYDSGGVLVLKRPSAPVIHLGGN